MKQCINCGQILGNQDKFCPVCGQSAAEAVEQQAVPQYQPYQAPYSPMPGSTYSPKVWIIGVLLAVGLVLGGVVKSVASMMLLFWINSGRITLETYVTLNNVVSIVAGYGLLLLMAFLGISMYNKRCLRDGQKGCALSMLFALVPVGVYAAVNLITGSLYGVLVSVLYSQGSATTTTAMVTSVLSMVLSLITTVLTVLVSCVIFGAVAKKKRI